MLILLTLIYDPALKYWARWNITYVYVIYWAYSIQKYSYDLYLYVTVMFYSCFYMYLKPTTSTEL